MDADKSSISVYRCSSAAKDSFIATRALTDTAEPYFTFFIHASIGPETVLSGVSIENTSDM